MNGRNKQTKRGRRKDRIIHCQQTTVGEFFGAFLIGDSPKKLFSIFAELKDNYKLSTNIIACFKTLTRGEKASKIEAKFPDKRFKNRC